MAKPTFAESPMVEKRLRSLLLKATSVKNLVCLNNW